MYSNNNNNNDDFAWMSNGLNSNNNNNNNNYNNKKKSKKAPLKSLNNMMTNNYNNNEYSFAVPMSKSNPPQPISEFLTGVPMSKSGYRPPSKPKPTSINNFIAQQSQQNEFLSGIPNSKSMPPTSLYNEFNSGVPMSKSGYIPRKHPSSYSAPNSVNNTTTTITKSNAFNDLDPFSTINSTEFNSGVPMSKSGRPLGVFNNHKLNMKKNTAFNTEYRSGVPMTKSGMPYSQLIRLEPMPTPDLFKAKSDTPSIEEYTADYPKYNTVIAIDDILKRDRVALKTLRRCLEARGWCKIKYPEKTNKVIKSVMDNVYKWFNSTEQNEKLKYSRKLSDGKPNPQSEYSYNRIPGFKEGLRILTGDIYKIHYENNKYPDSVKDDILKINKEFDGLSVKIMKCIYDTIYNLSDYKQFGNQYDISMLNDGQVLKLKYSMLDFVNYYNNKEYIDKIRTDEHKNDGDNPKPNVLKSEFNVFAHSDPGLFALSFSSTNEGLEMYDHVTEKWIPVGLNEGIWWNGKTANIIDNKIKSGEHRVKIDNKTFKPRFTGWYEVSCNKQLKPEIMKEALDMMKNGKNGDVNKMSGNILAGLDLAISTSVDSIKKSMSVDSITDEFNFPSSDQKQNIKKKGVKMSMNNNNNNNNNNNVEFNFGVPNSKNNNPRGYNNTDPFDNLFGNNNNNNESVTPPPSNDIAGFSMKSEYGSGVPMSKMWAPINVKVPTKNNNKKKSKKRTNEYNFGVPMSKSGF